MAVQNVMLQMDDGGGSGARKDATDSVPGNPGGERAKLDMSPYKGMTETVQKAGADGSVYTETHVTEYGFEEPEHHYEKVVRLNDLFGNLIPGPWSEPSEGFRNFMVSGMIAGRNAVDPETILYSREGVPSSNMVDIDFLGNAELRSQVASANMLRKANGEEPIHPNWMKAEDAVMAKLMDAGLMGPEDGLDKAAELVGGKQTLFKSELELELGVEFWPDDRIGTPVVVREYTEGSLKIGDVMLSTAGHSSQELMAMLHKPGPEDGKWASLADAVKNAAEQTGAVFEKAGDALAKTDMDIDEHIEVSSDRGHGTADLEY